MSGVERYLDSWQYAIKRTPIENLMFEIKVYRAPILNELEKTLVARRKFIPWAQKVYSPSELVTLFNSVYSSTGAGSTREDQLKRLLEPFQGESEEAKMKKYLNRLVLSDGTEEIIEALDEQEAVGIQVPEGLTPEQQDRFVKEQSQLAENRKRLQASYKQSYHIFTRPPSEGYLNPDELISEVIPPQPYTPLARNILRVDENGRDLSRSRGGGWFSSNSASSIMADYSKNNDENDDDANNASLFSGAGENPDVPFASRERSFFVCLATGQTSQPLEGVQSMAGSGLPGKFLWRGKEQVLIQLVKMGDGTLMTRPSLLDEHVVSVDENFITSFTISLSSTRDGNAALVDNAGKHLIRKSVLVDGVEDDDDFDDDGDEGTLRIVDASPDEKNNNSKSRSSSAASNGKKPTKKGRKGRNAEPRMSEDEQKRAASRDRRWLAIKSNVVKRGIVLEFAKRAQSPSTIDSRGGVNAAKMLRQALGLHDSNTNDNNKNNLPGFKTGAQVFGSKRSGAIPTLDIGNSDGNKKKSNAPHFITAPQKGILRVNFFVTLECVNFIERESIFARCSWVFPPAGVALDTEGNRKGGVRELMQITTQTSFASYITDAMNNRCTRHVLNVPIELHVLMHENSPGTPRLVIEIFSGGDGGGHQTLEGYALVTCSPVPGLQRSLRIDMWKPLMSGWEMMKSVFIGGSASLVDRETAAVPYGEIALEAQTLRNSVKRELSTQQALQNFNSQQQNVDPSQLTPEQQQLLEQQRNQMLMMNAMNPTNLSPEVENDLLAACSVASHSRAGLMTTSEGNVQVSIMCCVQKQQ